MDFKVTLFLLSFFLLTGLANATIQPAGNYGFGPCAQVHGGNFPNNSIHNKCLTVFTPLSQLTQGRYCDAQGSLVYNCSLCTCMAGYYCSPTTGTCDSCEAGEACFATQENALMQGATDFLNFIPSVFPLLIFVFILLMAVLLVAMIRHIGEY